MEMSMSSEDVIAQIKRLHGNGESLSKKYVKKSHPELMKNALYYYPSWEHAIQKTGVLST
ncbi:hypothetical protein ACI7RC_08980 [Brevibacillus sp. B_LB10_24]|uniref:hypothetical protein n=1 Tax=Brevibacillus sp. B_LB10_24 TaxID=3380645 RepID=UPI0038B71876